MYGKMSPSEAEYWLASAAMGPLTAAAGFAVVGVGNVRITGSEPSRWVSSMTSGCRFG